MSRLALRVVAVAAVIALLGVGSYAVAGGGSKNFKRQPAERLRGEPGHLDGRQPARSRRGCPTTAPRSTTSSATRGSRATVTQSHVHFAKPAVNGGISFWLCETANVQSPVRQHADLPVPGRHRRGRHHGGRRDRASGDRGPADGGQGIEAGNLAEILAAMRAGHAYANVHIDEVARRRDPRADRQPRRWRRRHRRRRGRLGGEAGFEARDHVERERRRPRPVDDAMVERDRDVADLADDDLPVADDGARADPVDAEDRRPRGG